ncbi:MAG: hypothetical protein KC561_17270, partial [Myxococcales bacterium]|nr:hypothetical protein [Myxococcales bacterium]
EWDRLGEVHQIVEYTYHNGYYDGVEKAFRGFEQVEEFSTGDESLADGELQYTYDIGLETPCRAGRVLQMVHVDDGDTIIVHHDEYDQCGLDGVPDSGLLFDVEFWCLSATEVELRERADSEDWVVQRQEFEYDGFGQRTVERDRGVVSVGGSTTCDACNRAAGEYGLACGEGCVGDENIVVTDFVQPGEDTDGVWVLGLPYRERIYPEDGPEEIDLYQEVLTYYDGPAFEGLPLGQASNGFVSRVEQRADADGRMVTAIRARSDQHGNVVEQINPLGEVGGDAYISQYEMDALGLRELSVDVLLGTSDQGSERLHQELRYDPIWGEVASATDLIRYSGDDPIHPVTQSIYSYDEFGRLASRVESGDSVASPTAVFSYELGEETVTITVASRTESAGPLDAMRVTCTDGLGRDYQTRSLMGPDQWLVSGYTIFNRGGMPRELFPSFISSSGECDTEPPSTGLSSFIRYDSKGRRVEVEHPDGHGERMEYEPQRHLYFDENDTDENSPFFDTPEIEVVDGLERVVARGRTAADGHIEWYHFT